MRALVVISIIVWAAMILIAVAFLGLLGLSFYLFAAGYLFLGVVALVPAITLGIFLWYVFIG